MQPIEKIQISDVLSLYEGETVRVTVRAFLFAEGTLRRRSDHFFNVEFGDYGYFVLFTGNVKSVTIDKGGKLSMNFCTQKDWK